MNYQDLNIIYESIMINYDHILLDIGPIMLKILVKKKVHSKQVSCWDRKDQNVAPRH